MLEEDDKRRPQHSETVVAEIKFIIDETRKRKLISVGEFIEGQYEIKRLLGESNISSTCLAYDVITKELCVLKFLKKPYQILPLIQGEYDVLRRLNHPGVVKLVGVFSFEKPFHFRYEYIKGPTLEDLIKGGPDSVKRLGLSLKELGEDLLDTFVYLEQNNVFHRDIAPKNIIYDQANERCRIVDFGSAISKEEASQEPVGTPLYWPPEMVQGKPWNETTDRYALATILYELGTGKLPFKMNDDGYCDKTVILLPGKDLIPEHCWKVLERALSVDKDQRFLSARDMLNAWRTERSIPQAIKTEKAVPIERLRIQEPELLSPEEFVRRAVTKLRVPPQKGIHSVDSGFRDAFVKYFKRTQAWAAKEIVRLAQEGKIVIKAERYGEMIYLPDDPPCEPPRLSHEEFLKSAITKLRKPPYKGIHSVFSGFNEAFRKYFGEDPVSATNRLAQEGRIIIRPAKGGAMLYLPDNECQEIDGRPRPIQSPIDKPIIIPANRRKFPLPFKGPLELLDQTPVVGDLVIITSGPMRGFVCTVKKIVDGRFHVAFGGKDLPSIYHANQIKKGRFLES